MNAQNSSDIQNIEKTTDNKTNQGKHFWCAKNFNYFETAIKWDAVIALALIHVVGIYSLIFYPYFTEYPTFLFHIAVGQCIAMGITAGAHRLFCHRSYKAKLPLKLFLMISFIASGQNSIYNWSRDHRLHHKFTDTDADPYNSKRGFFFSHVGWLMLKKKPEVIKKGKTIDMSDLLEDPLIQFGEKYFFILRILLCYISPMVFTHYVFGTSWFWSFGMNMAKYIYVLNMTWTVNSFAHFYGYRPYDKNISPRENGLVSIFSNGEGYHNYHHSFPMDYRAAENAFFSLTSKFIDMFAAIGWAYDMKTPSKELVQRVIVKAQK